MDEAFRRENRVNLAQTIQYQTTQTYSNRIPNYQTTSDHGTGSRHRCHEGQIQLAVVKHLPTL